MPAQDAVLTACVAGRIDPWRIMMALKSGQLVESTWALEVLSVLLYDDHTVVFFGLQHLPGLLDALLDHFRRSVHASALVSAADRTHCSPLIVPRSLLTGIVLYFSTGI